MNEDLTFKALDTPLEKIAAVVTQNYGADGLSDRELQKITVPGGSGHKTISVEGDEGATSVSSIDFIILDQRLTRQYWKEEKKPGENIPPDCFSLDSITGIGNPGGNCIKCPLAQFGTAKKGTGRGQACRQTRNLYILRAGEGAPVFPEILRIPPTSHKAFKDVIGQVTKKMIGLNSAVLTATIASKGDWAQWVFAFKQEIPERYADKHITYAALLNPAMKKATPELPPPDAAHDDDDEPGWAQRSSGRLPPPPQGLTPDEEVM
jgi:hypothetical protein